MCSWTYDLINLLKLFTSNNENYSTWFIVWLYSVSEKKWASYTFCADKYKLSPCWTKLSVHTSRCILVIVGKFHTILWYCLTDIQFLHNDVINVSFRHYLLIKGTAHVTYERLINVSTWQYSAHRARERETVALLSAETPDFMIWYDLFANKTQIHPKTYKKNTHATRLKNSTNSRPWKIKHIKPVQKPSKQLSEIKKITQINTFNWALKKQRVTENVLATKQPGPQSG